MKLARSPRKKREPDLTSLINIVFLILIFFLVAGALRPFSARDIQLAVVEPQAADRVAPGRLIIHSDGQMTYAGQSFAGLDIVDAIDQDPRLDRTAPFVIVADGRYPASELLKTVTKIRSKGIRTISVMTERRRGP